MEGSTYSIGGYARAKPSCGPPTDAELELGVRNGAGPQEQVGFTHTPMAGMAAYCYPAEHLSRWNYPNRHTPRNDEQLRVALEKMAERMVIYSEAVRQMNTFGERLCEEYSRLCTHPQQSTLLYQAQKYLGTMQQLTGDMMQMVDTELQKLIAAAWQFPEGALTAPVRIRGNYNGASVERS